MPFTLSLSEGVFGTFAADRFRNMALINPSDRQSDQPDSAGETSSDRLVIDPGVQNVQALTALHAKSEREVTRHQRLIESLTAGLGRPITLYGLLTAVLLWIFYNLSAPALGLPRPDPPPFVWLQGVVGLAALLMTTMVLITQQRQGKMAARRTLLDLHVNLLSEQKVAKLIALLEELRRDLPSVDNRHDAQAEAMARPLDPQAAIARLEEQIEQAIAGQPGRPDASAVAERMAAEVAEVVREATEPEDQA